MNKTKLKKAQRQFLKKYPGGFMHPEMQQLGKKHKMNQLIALSQECFSKDKFKDTALIIENMNKIVSRSSMVSMFEKPRFRDFINTLGEKQTKSLTNGLRLFLHSDQCKGLETMVSVLKPAKLAKWSLISILPNYYHPNDEVFVKPTTAKGVIDYFELKDLVYHPLPTWEFYHKYRTSILEMKSITDESLTPNNAAFSGFLMMSITN